MEINGRFDCKKVTVTRDARTRIDKRRTQLNPDRHHLASEEAVLLQQYCLDGR